MRDNQGKVSNSRLDLEFRPKYPLNRERGGRMYVS